MNVRQGIDGNAHQVAGQDVINVRRGSYYKGDVVINLFVLNAPLTTDIHGGNNILGNHGEVRMQIEGAGQRLEQAIAELLVGNEAALRLSA